MSRGRHDGRAPIETLATLDEDGRTLTVLRRGEHLELSLGQVPLLSSAALGTEVAFGALASRVAERPRPRVLLGGLGLGGTLRGALAALGDEAEVVVAEKLRALPELLTTHEAFASYARGLDDPRVRVVRADVWDALDRDGAAGEGGFDAVLLDVDNGPEWASFRTNARLYSSAGLARAREALRPRGLLAVWSGYPRDAFVAALRSAGLEPSIVPLEEGGRVRARAYVGALPP